MKRILLEFTEKAIQQLIKKFSDTDERTVRMYLDNFEKYKNGLEKKDPFQYKTFMELEQAVDAAKGKAEFKRRNKDAKGKPKEYVNGKDESGEAIIDDENVTIYKGDSEDKCVKYGNGYSFCISRPVGGNMYGSYRMSNASTFYFIYFKKVPKSDPKHIMVLDRTTNGWEWTFADNNTQEVQGGWDEVVKDFPVLAPYEKVFTNKPMTPKEKKQLEDVGKFVENPHKNLFDSFDYETKTLAVKSGNRLPDDIFESLDKHLRNEYINTGCDLTKLQADVLTAKEVKRYRKVRKNVIPHLLDNDVRIRPSKLDIGLNDNIQFTNKITVYEPSGEFSEYDLMGNLLGRFGHNYRNLGFQSSYIDSNGKIKYSVNWKGDKLIATPDGGYRDETPDGTIRYYDHSGEMIKTFDPGEDDDFYFPDKRKGKRKKNRTAKKLKESNILSQKDLLQESTWKKLFPFLLESKESPFAVFVVYQFPNGKIAATTRPKDRESDDKGVKVGLPGGKVDPGEDPTEAAIRESQEEGWEVSDLEYKHSDIVQGKTVWWFRAKNAKPLKEYKEKYRGIIPTEVDMSELKGFGNEIAIPACLS